VSRDVGPKNREQSALGRSGRPPARGVGRPEGRGRVGRIRLPKPAIEDGAGLWGVVARRRSIRRFAEQPLTLREASQLLWAAQGVTARTASREFRAAPSAGARYPLETYVEVNRVEGIEPGLYRYVPAEHSIEPVRPGDLGSELAEAALGQQFCRTAGLVMIWSAVIERSKSRYGERAYRYAYLDAGHIAQNVYLGAEALDLGCCAVGAFYDEEADAFVGADGRGEFVVYMAAVGKKAAG